MSLPLQQHIPLQSLDKMSDSADKDDFDWGAPMPHEMKVTFAIIEKLTDDFAMTMWKEISAASSMSLATAK